MRKVGFVGLGIMGAPMAAHLQRAGYEVTGYRRSQRYDALTAAAGSGASSLSEAVRDADVVAIMVPDSADVRDVLEGPDGVFAHVPEGALLIDFSSIRPDVARDLAAQASARGLQMLDAPVSGGEAGAVAATLSIMVGGEAEAFDRAKPLFGTVGKTIVHVGPSGAGQTVKAANQLMVAVHIQALSEAMLFLEAYGVDLPAAIEVLGGGLAGSAVLTQKAEKMLDREFSPGFRIGLHHKDMGIVTAAAREAGLPIPAGALVAQLIAAANARGDGGLDHSALFRVTESLATRPSASGDA